jgi:hypothetical protein
MKRIIFIILISVTMLTGCVLDKQYNKINDTANNTKITEASNTISATNHINQKAENVNIIDVSDSGLYRESNSNDKDGFCIRPYLNAGAIFTFAVKPNENSQVTILSIGVKLSSFNTSINEIEEVNFDTDENNTNVAYNVYIENITDERYLESKPLLNRRDDTPFDVCCIYPAVKKASIIDLNAVDLIKLPEKNAKDIKCLVDINEDMDPDVMIVETKIDDYTTSSFYIKKNEKWTLLKEALPM